MATVLAQLDPLGKRMRYPLAEQTSRMNALRFAETKMIPAPKIQWPSELTEEGPASDPCILLSGDALIGGMAFKVTALRVLEKGRGPDFREDIAEEEYAVSLEGLKDSVEELAESIDPARIEINGRHYLLWMVPYPAGEEICS